MRRMVLLVGALVAAGCGGRQHDPDDAGEERDAASERDAGNERDAATGHDAGPPLVCDCAERVPVGMFHACTPPLEMGCAIEVCTPGGDECGAEETCEDCAAAACCECAACVPACVRTEASPGDPMPELLKLAYSWGPGGEETDVVVEGAPFYIGALGYTVRLGASEELLQIGGEGPCGLTVRMPARPAGTMMPVWVSQYGFSEPWVLAGFFSWIEDMQYPSCAQPGLGCGEDHPCCETAEVAVSCREGRCRRD